MIVGALIFFESLKANPNNFNPASAADVSGNDSGNYGNSGTSDYSGKDSKFRKAPELVGIDGYINTDNVSIAENRGKVVLIDFWTYTCVNCIRTLPSITAWDAKYRSKGLVIIGVHTPEFTFEKKIENVQAAVDKYQIRYPVVLDNNYQTWNAFENRYWPRKYLIDGDGYIRYDHIGEGGYEETEKMIQELLSELGESVNETVPVDKINLRSRITPELYAGSDFSLPRGQDIGNEGGLKANSVTDYILPESLPRNVIILSGKWKSNPDDLEAVANSPDGSASSVLLNFIASEVNIVAESTGEPVELDVLIDGVPITAAQAGDDVVVEQNRSYVKISEPRLYNLFRGSHGKFDLKLDASEGFKFNAFTFG